MVGTAEYCYNLMLFVLDFGDAEIGVFLLEIVWIDEDGLMSEKLFAGCEMLWE